MRAVIQLLNDGYVNISADAIEQRATWIVILLEGKIVGIFDEGNVKCAFICQRKDINNDRNGKTQNKDKNRVV